MPTTTNRGYEVPATGDYPGTWGDNATNPNFEAIDQNLGAVASVSVTTANVTLSAGQYACGTIRFSGTLTGNRTVTFPSVSGWWTIDNRCTGDFYVRISCSGGGNKICPPPGELIDVQADGTDFMYRNLPHPIGTYWDYAGNAVPNWVAGCTVPPYLYCDGSSFSAVTYPFLNTVLNGTTLPDTRGRLRATINDGTSRIVTANCGINGNNRFQAGGFDAITLTTAQLASHTHVQTAQNPTFTFVTDNVAAGGNSAVRTIASTGLSSSVTTASDASPGSTASSGSGDSHNNMPPTYTGGITMIRAA